VRAPALAALFCGATFIALSPIWVRVADVGPTASAFWRVALAVPLLWGLVACLPKPAAVSRRDGWLLAAAGLAFAGDLAFWHWSIQATSVANATLLANLSSIFVTLAAWLLWRQRPSGLFLVGLALALCGVALLVRASLGFSPGALVGDAYGVVTAMFYAWYLLTVKRLRDLGAATLRLMAVTTTLTAAILLPLALASGEPMLPAGVPGLARALRPRLDHARGRPGPDHVRAGAPARSVLLGRPAAAARARRRFRLGAARRAARHPADRRRGNGARGDLPRAARLERCRISVLEDAMAIKRKAKAKAKVKRRKAPAKRPAARRKVARVARKAKKSYERSHARSRRRHARRRSREAPRRRAPAPGAPEAPACASAW
jgi:drug/metabolite transporter (DMT)-like permease